MSDQYAGSGLGLSITKSLVEIMGGTITVESVLGQGTTFVVELRLQRVTMPETEPRVGKRKDDIHPPEKEVSRKNRN